MRQWLRIYACLLGLIAGGGGGALLLDGTLGARERERVRARQPGESVCGGPGIDIYLAGGFLLGVAPAAWLLWRLGAVRRIVGAAADAEPPVGR